MEATFAASSKNTVKFYYTKRKNSIGTETSRYAVGRANLWTSSSSSSVPPPCNDQFKVGAFYEIDHGKLPPKTPIQLKALRVVKVSEITKLDLTVNFPSILALRNYFTAKPRPTGADTPELDEKLVMSNSYAGRSLQRLIPAAELEAEKHLQSFWLIAPLLQHEDAEVEEAKSSMSAAMSGCLMVLKFNGFLQWGVRRKVKYIGRHRDTLQKLHVPAVKKDEEEEDEVKQEQQPPQQRRTSGRKRTRVACRKDRGKKNGKTTTKKKSSKKKPKLEIGNTVKNKNTSPAEGSRERWSMDRYKSSELRLLEIMREKGAEIGSPILRQELREAARKRIGDTGLLDHLLKHMAGKAVGEGADRFQRRHNAEGAMEYWLEPAELMEIRQTAGVTDPYWFPPAGWKLGDATSLCVCGGECRKETNRLKEEMSRLERDMEQLRSLKHLLEKERADAQTALAVDRCCSSSSSSSSSSDWQEKYEKLLDCTVKMEAQMVAFSSTIDGLKEEVEELKVEEEKREKAIGIAVTEAAAKQSVVAVDYHVLDRKMMETKVSTYNRSSTIGEEESLISQAAEKKGTAAGGVGVRKSGFRLCKPQGTFLWPNMGAAAGGGSGNSSVSWSGGAAHLTMVPATSHHYYQQQQMMMLFGGGGGSTGTATGGGGIPTPPSASSTSSPNKQFLLPSPTTPTSSQPSPLLVLPAHVLTRTADCGDVKMKSGGGRKDGGGSTSDVTTDLALAPPSPFA